MLHAAQPDRSEWLGVRTAVHTTVKQLNDANQRVPIEFIQQYEAAGRNLLDADNRLAAHSKRLQEASETTRHLCARASAYEIKYTKWKTDTAALRVKIGSVPGVQSSSKDEVSD